jgi:hypothetical protein
MRNTIIVAIALLVGSASQVLAQQQFISFKNVQLEYKSLADVKPVLKNDGKKSIFLWPEQCGEALVSFSNGKDRWDSDLKECSPSFKPIKVKPGRSYDVPALVLRFERAEGQFVEDTIGKPGKFKITVSYSYKPYYRLGRPQLKESISREFAIIQ